MKLNFSDFPRKCQFPLMLALGSMPLHTILLVHNAPDCVYTLSVFLPVFVLLAWLCLIIPGKLRVACCAAGCASLLALGLYLLPVLKSFGMASAHALSVSQSIFSFLVPILLCALLVYSLRFAAWRRDTEFSFNSSAVGVILHAAGQLAVSVHKHLTPSPYDPVKHWMALCFIAYMPLVLLSINRMSMLDAGQNRQRAPVQMRRINAAITLCFFGLVLLIAVIPAVMQAVEQAWNTLLRAIWAVIEWIISLMPGQSAPGGPGIPGEGGMFGPIEAAEPSLLAVILEAVLKYFALAIGAVLLLLFLRIVLRKAAQLLRAALSGIQAYLAAASGDYVDEVTDTRADGEHSTQSLVSLLKRIAPVNESRLSPAERIRFRYRRMLHRHGDWHESRTARENLPQSAAALYERARYSEHPITSEQAEQFSADTRNL